MFTDDCNPPHDLAAAPIESYSDDLKWVETHCPSCGDPIPVVKTLCNPCTAEMNSRFPFARVGG